MAKPASSRARTLGVRVTDKKTIFQWSKEGKLQEVKITQLPEDKQSDNDVKTDKPTKVGSL